MRSAYLRRVLGVWGILVAILIVVVMMALAEPFEPGTLGPGHDARAYWSAQADDPYAPSAYGSDNESFCWTPTTWISECYRYSPAFLLAFSPFQALPWAVFVGLWTTLMLGVLWWMTRALLFLPLVLLSLPELWGGNITILIAAAIVLGFSRPYVWALPLLTKVTPGLGLLWFGVRREWLKLGIAAAATAIVIAVAALFTPGIWDDWFAQLTSGSGSNTVPGSVPVPLLARLPLAAAVIAFAAWRGQHWLVPIGVLLAMPVIWWGYVAILSASVALRREVIEDRIEAFLAALETRWDRRIPAAGNAAVRST